jgi:eukaryotic-like serine/threonine-protein kinase
MAVTGLLRWAGVPHEYVWHGGIGYLVLGLAGVHDAQRSADQEQRGQLAELHQTAVQSFQRVADELIEAIRTYATAAELLTGRPNVGRSSFDSLAAGKAFVAILNDAKLGLDTPQPSPSRPGTLPITVVSESVITVTVPRAVYGWAGRSHSLWFCNAFEKDRFAWYEVAFMASPLGGGSPTMEPFATAAAASQHALMPIIGQTQLAWDFEELDRSDLSEFVNRWLGWFGTAAQGRLQRPGMLPEKPERGGRWWN